MIAILLAATISLAPQAGRLQPGTGIVTGTIKMEGGGSPARVRVSAMDPGDPSSLVSVTQTDASGNFRLTNIPEGKYFIVAGPLEFLTYFPGGSDRTKAREVKVEAAKVTTIDSFAVPAQSARRENPTIPRMPANDQEYIAYIRINSERNIEAKKKLLINFARDYPRSNRLAEAYMEHSRLLASQTDFVGASQYAEKAVTLTSRMKNESQSGGDRAWQAWVASLDASAQTNLAWTKQMIQWQQRQVHNAILGKR